MARLFLLSPASCHGRRAQIFLNPTATFDLACRLRSQGVTLGEAFSFLSGLYFRGKLAYAQRFANGGKFDGAGVQVITAGRGLLPASTVIRDDDLRAFVDVPVDPKDERYLAPLVEGARKIDGQLKRSDEVVLLGSIATDKYCGPLGEVFGDRLRFPSEFIGRGDMSRGGLMLRCVDAGEELTYIPLAGAVRKGTRPAKLPRRSPK